MYTFIYTDTYIWLSVFTNVSSWTGCDPRSIFKQSLIGMNSEFSFSSTSCYTKVKEPSQPYYLPIAGGRIVGFIPFRRVLVLCEMQSVSFRIWTRFTVSIFNNNGHYTMGTVWCLQVWIHVCMYVYMYVCIYVSPMYACLYEYKYMYVYIYICMFVSMSIYVCSYVFMFVCMHICMYICMQLYICMLVCSLKSCRWYMKIYKWKLTKP